MNADECGLGNCHEKHKKHENNAINFLGSVFLFLRFFVFFVATNKSAFIRGSLQ